MRRTVKEREIGFDDVGRGAPLVLLHPFPFSRAVWGEVVPALAASRRVIAVDARGFGDSALRAQGGASAAYALTDLADDLAALLDELGVSRAALLGMSMGGYTALAFAARHGARLAALVLADTRAAADTPEARAKRDEALATIHGRGADAYLDGSLGRMLSTGAAPALHARVRAGAVSRADALVAAVEALRDRPDRTAELPAIACPTLLVCGADDQITPAAEMRRMSETIGSGVGKGTSGRARYVELAGAGHLSHVEAPQPFTEAVNGFLAEVLRS
jgi:pimeloyl-ACP methyl ester carboxylesterase